MVRVISQSTYDDVVKENIEELDMNPEEAIKDAIAQFQAQGVDLSNVIKDLVLSDGKQEHIVCSTVATLIKMHDSWEKNVDILKDQLNILKLECSKDLARRVRAGKEGAYPMLLNYLEKSADLSNDEVTVNILETLIALMDSQPDLLDNKGIDSMKRLLQQSSFKSLQVLTLRWISTCCLKHEMNRQAVFKSQLTNRLMKMLKEPLDDEVLTELLTVYRRLCMDDDIRVEFGKAHEHAREIAVSCITPLTHLLKENISKAGVSSELMLTIASLLVRHEFCQAVADAGGTDILFDVTTQYYDNVVVTMQALKLIKALAGNDDVKRSLVKSGITPVIVSLLNRHMSNAKASSLALSCVGALTLREPAHSELFARHAAPEAIVDALKTHPDNISVQRNACWAVRNMVARCRDLSAKFVEVGAESCLQTARQRFSELDEDTKAALRDLGSDIKLLEQWRGRGVQMLND